MELNMFDSETTDFKFIGYSEFTNKISLRAFFVSDRGDIVVRYANSDEANPNWEKDHCDEKLANVVQTFCERVFESILGIK
jgi:hypothetical protein